VNGAGAGAAAGASSTRAAAGFFVSEVWADEPTTTVNARATDTLTIAQRTIIDAENDEALSVLFIPSLLANSMSEQPKRSLKKRISTQTG
jgi:hypothetical protein